MLLSHKVVNFLGFCFLFLNLRLCLFWVKSISRNAFPYLRVFGCARKMHFPEMLFSWPLNGCKLISVSILPSNSHFSENTERAEWEGDAPACREREREREREEEPRRAQLRSSSLTASHPKTDRPPDRRPRPHCWIVLDPDCRPRSRRLSGKPIVLEPHRCPRSRSHLSSNPVAIAAPIGFGDLACRRTQSRLDYEFFFFFLGVICVSGLRNEIIIFVWQRRKSEKMWARSRKCIFHGIFNNTTKHHKIFFTIFSQIQPNTWKYFPFRKIAFPENKYFPENILREPNTA